MQYVMCEACGEFVAAHETGERVRPVADACPECGSDRFVDPVERND